MDDLGLERSPRPPLRPLVQAFGALPTMADSQQHPSTSSFKDMVSGQPLDQASFFTKFSSNSSFYTTPRGNYDKEETTHPQQYELPKSNEDIVKRITKDTWAEKGKAIDSPFPANVNPSKSQEKPQDQGKKTKNNCNPNAKKIPELEIQDPEVAEYKEYMQEHVVIWKFMGIWPTERALKWWIQRKWTPKGEIRLQLGSKGFFTVIFELLEIET